MAIGGVDPTVNADGTPAQGLMPQPGMGSGGGSDPLTSIIPGIGGLASGIGGIIGGNTSNDLNMQEFLMGLQYNTTQAQNARQWQAAMRGTGYQATVADLRAAGLNPMLAVQNGPNSAGAAPMASAPSANAAQNVLGTAMSSATQSASTIAQALAAKAQAGTAAAAQASQATLQTAQAMRELSNAKQSDEITKNLQSQEDAIKSKAAYDVRDNAWKQEHYTLQKTMDLIGTAMGSSSNATQAAQNVINMMPKQMPRIAPLGGAMR